MVCVQEAHRAAVELELAELPGRPVVWFLGNTTRGYDRAAARLGRERVLGGFPGVGGTWDGDVLLYADRETPEGRPFDRLVIGEAFDEAAPAARSVREPLVRAGMHVDRHVPIMAWHWSHVALVLPLAAAVYSHDNDLAAVVADGPLLVRAIRATRQALGAVQRAGHPVLPRRLNLLRWVPAVMGARKIATLLASRFGQIALAGHAATARDEMRSLAADLLTLAGDGGGKELRELMQAV
jgi:2-dehydropantoate 2-reductase